jgi:hypothetical protein
MRIALSSIRVDDQDNAMGVNFRGEPTVMGTITAVLFEDSCGNLINLVQPF